MDEPGMTCFFPCDGAVLKTEGTRAQPTAIAPPPARQLGAAGEPPMPAPSWQGAAASPGQVRLRGDPPSGARGSAAGRPAGQAGRADGPGAAGLPAGAGSGRLCPPAGADPQQDGDSPRSVAFLGTVPSPPRPWADTQPRRPRHPWPRRGGTERRPARGGACRGGLRAPGEVCGCVSVSVCASGACVCASHRACASGDSAAAAPGEGQKFWGSAPQCWRAAEPAVAGPGQRDTGTLECRGSGVSGQRHRRLRAGDTGTGGGGRGCSGAGARGPRLPRLRALSRVLTAPRATGTRPGRAPGRWWWRRWHLPSQHGVPSR